MGMVTVAQVLRCLKILKLFGFWYGYSVVAKDVDGEIRHVGDVASMALDAKDVFCIVGGNGPVEVTALLAALNSSLPGSKRRDEFFGLLGYRFTNDQDGPPEVQKKYWEWQNAISEALR